jgi:general secretion pathway protein J
MPPLTRATSSPEGEATRGLAKAVSRWHWLCGAPVSTGLRGAKPPAKASVLNRSARGFTLIELLVAIGVMALIAILSWRGLDGMVRAQEQTRQRADEMLVLQAALGQWGTDLDALMQIAHTTPLDWDGQVLRMTRRSSAVPDEGALVVAWTRRNNVQGIGQWMRWQSPPVRTRADWQEAWELAAQWARTPGDAERRFEVTLLPLTDWQIFYYRGGAWSNPLSSTGTAAPGDGTSAIPDGVRLQVTLPPGQALAGQLTRDWVKPVLGGGRS